MGPSQNKALHLKVSGRVQGVFFRAWTQETAQSLGLCGWVRNLPNGKVEIFAEGKEADLHLFLTRCHEGPPAASVSRIQSEWQDASGEMADFIIRP